MSDLSSIGSNGSVGPINRITASPYINGVAKAAQTVEPVSRLGVSAESDRVELSDFARYLEQIRKLPDARLDRVTQVREAIAQGTYETGDKLDQAIQRLAEEELH